jgi:hypothetical protein
MLNIHTEMANGAVSKGYDVGEFDALVWFTKVKYQLLEIGFVGHLVLSEDGTVLQREAINAA